LLGSLFKAPNDKTAAGTQEARTEKSIFFATVPELMADGLQTIDRAAA
jgi:hypothetical protein